MRPGKPKNTVTITLDDLNKRVDETIKEIDLVEVAQGEPDQLRTNDLARYLERVGSLRTDDETRGSITYQLVSLFKICTITVTLAVCIVFVWVGVRPVEAGAGGINDLVKLAPYLDRTSTTIEMMMLAAISYFFGKQRGS